MMKGICGKILMVDLTTQTVKQVAYPQSFYRSYLGGGGIGAYMLLKHTTGDTDPLGPGNVITIAPGVTTGAAVSGVSRCSVTALSPETGAVGDTQAGGNFGPFLKRSGFDAVVITGKAQQLSCLIVSHDTAEIVSCTELAGKTVLEVHDALSSRQEGKKISILQCGIAGEHMVQYASLASDLNNVFGRTGMGAVFGSKNLKAVVVSGEGTVPFVDPDGVKALARTGADRVRNEGAADVLKRYGTPGIVQPNALKGNLSTHNYTSGYHDRYMDLDGRSFEETIASKGTTCYGCVIGCRKTVKCEAPYAVTERLGGPEFETLGVLGSNLDITDAAAVAKANELCNNYGLDTISFGSIVSYLWECMERELIDPSAHEAMPSGGFGNAEALLELIELTARRIGVGDILADGFTRTVEYFGMDTEPYAVHTKNHGFAVHMAQVKQTMALMYAVSPIGADHMSCEHDWLAADTSEAAQGLGLLNPAEELSYGIEKVRSVVYSQLYYGMLDSLGLCMFCWGTGSLYTYKELTDLIRYTTGWDVTLWELMKAGERRITMMRMINHKRGFTKKDDRLPEQVFTPLRNGPTEGRSVDRVGFTSMRDTYYAVMGWDPEGVPTRGKLAELDLVWTT